MAKRLNKNNFLLWEGDIQGYTAPDAAEDIVNPYIKLKDCFAPIFVPDEYYSFYINSEQPFQDASYTNWQLGVYKGNTRLVSNVAPLLSHGSGNGYKIFCNLFFPELPNGTYTFVIYNGATIIARSNPILCENDSIESTTLLVYRNYQNKFNFDYELVPNFYNCFRLTIHKTEYQYEIELNQYRNVSGQRRLRNLRSERDKFIKLLTYHFNELAHDAMSAVAIHSDVFLNNDRYIAKGGYQVNQDVQRWSPSGEIEMYPTGEVYAHAIVPNFTYYYGPFHKIPTTLAELQQLIGTPAVNQIDISTGTTQTFFIFAVDQSKTVVSITDLNVTIGNNITTAYRYRSTIGNLKIYALQTAVPYTESHIHRVILS